MHSGVRAISAAVAALERILKRILAKTGRDLAVTAIIF